MFSSPFARRTIRIVPLTLALALSVIAPAIAQSDNTPPRTSVAGGPTPAADAAGWSQVSFAAGAAPTVLIATNSDFADALSAGAVQGLLEAPLLLTQPEVLSPETAAEITRLGSDRAIIFGGEEAVGPAVEAELNGLGLETERVEGPTRIETAVAAQQRFFPNATAAVLARAFGTDADPTRGFADTISVGAYATVSNTPVLLTETDVLSEATASALQSSTIDTVTIVGGTAAIEEPVAGAVAGISTSGSTEEFPGITVRRLAGLNRFDTAVKVNNDLGYTTAADSPRVIVVEGQAPDAWTGGLPAAVQAGNGASIVLANGDLLLSPTFDFLFDAGVPLICGPNVTATACDKAFAALQGEGEADMPSQGGSPDGEPSEQPSGEPTEEPTEEGPTGTPVDEVIDLIPTGAPTPGPSN